MCGHKRSSFGLGTLAVFIAALWAEAAERGHAADAVRLGMVGTLFRDVSESGMLAVMAPLVNAQTGISGQLLVVPDAHQLAYQLTRDKVHLGVFHGIEFGWARQKYPEIKPLLIAVNENRNLRALLVVRRDRQWAGMNDLCGKAMALPQGAHKHCEVFLTQACVQAGTEPCKFFGKLTTPSNAEEALDDVVDGVVDGAVVDGLAYECFKRRKPGRFAKLRTAEQSEDFPAAVIAYRPGGIDDAALQRFRNGMINANQNAAGRKLLTLWKLTAFEPIPPDYEQMLAHIVTTYPEPVPTGR